MAVASNTEPSGAQTGSAARTKVSAQCPNGRMVGGARAAPPARAPPYDSFHSVVVM